MWVQCRLSLLKHSPGAPLTPAELIQRRIAARSRWKAGGVQAGVLAAGGGVGGGIGAGVGAYHGLKEAGAREFKRRSQASAEAEAAFRTKAVEAQHEINAARRALREARTRDWMKQYNRWAEQLRETVPKQRGKKQPKKTLIEAMYGSETVLEMKARKLVNERNEMGMAGGAPRMTNEEVHETYNEILNDLKRQARPAPAVEFKPFRPIIGNKQNKLIYDREIWDLKEKKLKPAIAWRERLITKEVLAVGGDPTNAAERAEAAATNAVRPAHLEISDINRQIKDFEDLKTRGFRRQARSGHVQQRKTGKVNIAPQIVEQHRGGDTVAGMMGRRSKKKAKIEADMKRFLGRHDLQTARRVKELERHIADRLVNEAKIEAGFRQFKQPIWEAGPAAAKAGAIHGGKLGAAIGLTAAGVSLLAYHAVKAVHRRLKKSADGLPLLAKAATPEDEASISLARAYRRWIDRLLGLDERPINFGDGFAEALAPLISDSFAKGLTTAPVVQPDDPRYRIDVDFDLFDPAQERHIAEYALRQIVEMSNAQREAIRAAVRDQSVLEGIGPIEVARTIRQAIGLTTYQQSVVASFRTQLDQLDPRALERELRDKRYDRTLRAAIASNTPLDADKINAMVDAYHRRMLALRAQTIARTESIRAESYGGLSRAQQILDQNPELEVTKRWLATADNRTRDTHRDLNGKEVDGMTTHFITSAGNQIRWPLDDTAAADEVINCRCTLQYIFKPRRGHLMAVAA